MSGNPIFSQIDLSSCSYNLIKFKLNRKVFRLQAEGLFSVFDPASGMSVCLALPGSFYSGHY